MWAHSRTVEAAIGVAVLSLSAGVAEASGFQLAEQSARGLGNAFAGGAALADDVETIFFNPAGLTRLQKRQTSQAISWIRGSGHFDDDRSVDGFGTPLTGGEGGDASAGAWLPAFYVGMPIDDKWAIGLAINTPFGLKTEYNRTWIGRYHAGTSAIKTLNIQPTVAYRIDEQWSVGVGFNVQYVEAQLTQAVDFGAIAVGALGPAPAAALGLKPQKSDGKANIQGDDISFGYNVGVLYEHDQDTRLGVHFRSKISHELEGDAEFVAPPEAAPILATGAFAKSDVTARAVLPETASISAWRRIDEKLSIMADVSWTRWSRLRELRVKFDNPLQPDSAVPLSWDDTTKFALGAEYEVDATWTLRAGVAYDQSPTKHHTRTPRIPGQDRTWLAVGASYQVNEDLRLHLGYTHIWVDSAHTHVTESTGSRIDGSYAAKVDILAFGGTMDF